MESERRVSYDSPTAPPLHHYYPQPSHPGPLPPQQPPPYGAPGTVPSPLYGTPGTVPSPPYGTPGTVPSPPYSPPGTVQYGFQSPPPPYSGDPPPGYYQGYSPAPPAPYNMQPPMPPGGYGLYPDLSPLQQPPQVPYPNDKSSSTNSSVPMRPAPPPPGQFSASVPDAGSPTTQKCSFAHLKAGETPPGYVVQWRGGEGLQIFFLQKEGHVVSPKKPVIMTVYKKICVQGNPEGMVEVHGCWRLRLTGKFTPVLHTTPNCYTFMDTSTCPSRIAIVQMSQQLTKKMSEDLLALLTELSDLRNEEGGVVGKVTTGVATVYDDLTHKLNTVVKDTVPGAHKSTKWLRKGTGSLVRMGGSLVSRGMHLVADQMPANEKQEEESPAHTELLNGLKRYKECLQENSITYVN